MAEQIHDGGTAFPMQDSQAIHAYAAARVDGITDTAERDRVYLAARAEAIGGMSLRDYFATNAPTNEVQELEFRHLSRAAQEAITGLSYPQKPMDDRDSAGRVAFQIAEFEFKCQVNAAIRFKLADAMLRARKGGA